MGQILLLQSASVAVDGRAVLLTFAAPATAASTIPRSRGAVTIDAPWGPNLVYLGAWVTFANGTLTWVAVYLVPPTSPPITVGNGVLVQGLTSALVDRAGNASGWISIEPTNNSLVDARGFSTTTFTRGTGGVDVYVSSSRGSDANSWSQAQLPTTPFATLAHALTTAFKQGQHGKGCAVRVLRGDTVAGNTGPQMGGQDPLHPFVLEDYWEPSFGPDPGVAPTIIGSLFTSGGAQTPSPLNDVVIRRLSFSTPPGYPGTPNAQGFSFTQPFNNWLIDDCSFDRFGIGVGVQASGNGSTLLRCKILDSFGTGAHTQGLFVDGVNGLLVSQCTIDFNGRQSVDLTARDEFSHNVYIQFTCGPAIVWGNTITNGGNDGLQLRCGGVAAYNYFAGNASAGFIDGVGGSMRLNVVEDAQDISAAIAAGFGLALNGANTVTNVGSVAQDMSHNIAINSAGSAPQAASIGETNGPSTVGIELATVHHNTWVGAGPFGFNFDQNSITQLLDVVRNILVPIAGAPCYAGVSVPSGPWYSADENVLAGALIWGSGRTAMTLAEWQAATSTEPNSIAIAPVFVNPAACAASYAAAMSVGVSGADLVAACRARGIGAWGPLYDMTLLFAYYAAAFTPTNLPALGPGPGEYCGAVDYRI